MLRQLVPATLLCATSLFAQGTCYQIPDAVFSGASVTPFGHIKSGIGTWGNQRYQQLILKTDVNNKVGTICDLGFAPAGTGVRHFDSIKITLGYFALTGTTLGTNFANNMKNSQVVLDATNYEWPHGSGRWNPIGLDKSFTYTPQLGHLVIEVIVTGAYFTGSGSSGFNNAGSLTSRRQRLYNFRWGSSTPPATGTWSSAAGLKVQICYSTGMLSNYGLGCRGSNNVTPTATVTGTPTINNQVNVHVTGGLAKANVFLVFGLNRPKNPFPLPGTTSCRLYTSLEIIGLGQLTQSGTFRAGFKIPNNKSLNCTKLYFQAFPVDAKANSFRTSATGFARILVGL